MVNVTVTHLSIGDTVYNLTDPTRPVTTPTAWSPLTLTWGTSDGLEPPEPAMLTCRVTIPPGGPMPAYGDRVLVDFQVTSPDPNYDSDSSPLFTGYVDGADRTANPDGSYDLTITAADDLARLAKIRIGDDPWPDELSTARIDRIRELVADRVTIDDIGGNSITLAARDVDNFSAFDALRLCIAHTGHQLIATRANGITELRPPQFGAHLSIPATGPLYIGDEQTNAHELLAEALTDEPRTLSISSVITHASYTYKRRVLDDQGESTIEETTLTVANAEAARRYGETRWSLESDVLHKLDGSSPFVPDPRPMLTERLQRIILARSREFWAMQPVQVLLEEWPYYRTNGIRNVLLEALRVNLTVRIEGAPGDVDRFMRVARGQLTVHADQTQADLTLTLEPETFAVPEPIDFGTLGFYPEATFDRATQLTFADVASVTTANNV